MLRPNKPTKRKQRRNAFGQFVAKKPKPIVRTFEVSAWPSRPTSGVEWERSPEAGWRAKREAKLDRGTTTANALIAALERGETLPEPLAPVVHQPIQRTLWQRLWGFWRGRA